MQDIRGQLVTIIGSSYIQPLSDLLFRLLSWPNSKNNDVKTSDPENGYSVSIILLLVAMLESYVMRVRYFNRDQIPIEKSRVFAYLKRLYPDPDFALDAHLKEVFVVRDIITHNHLWEVNYLLSEDSGMKLVDASREHASGDSKYEHVADSTSNRTKALGLNVLPPKIDRSDVSKVFDVVWDTLLFLEHKNRNQCYVSHLYVKVQGQHRLFGDLRNDLRNAL
jgi:hypothetical protein